jgi:hypothetical protein
MSLQIRIVPLWQVVGIKVHEHIDPKGNKRRNEVKETPRFLGTVESILENRKEAGSHQMLCDTSTQVAPPGGHGISGPTISRVNMRLVQDWHMTKESPAKPMKNRGKQRPISESTKSGTGSGDSARQRKPAKDIRAPYLSMSGPKMKRITIVPEDFGQVGVDGEPNEISREKSKPIEVKGTHMGAIEGTE